MAPKLPPANKKKKKKKVECNADEEGGGQKEIDFVSSSKKNLAQKTPISPHPNPPPPPPAAADDDEDEDSGSDDKELGGGDKKQEGSELEGDEEEGSGDEEEESDDSEDENTKENKPVDAAQPKMQHKPVVPKPTHEPSHDSGSDSDSSSEEAEALAAPVSAPRPSRSADPSVKPISSKPKDAPPKPTKTKPATSPAPAPSQDRESLKRKRKHEEVELEQQENNNGGLKTQFFRRFWSLEDEVVLLNGLLEYRSKNGALPSTKNMEGFHNFIIGSLQVVVSSSQLVNKVRSLKKKFARTRNGADLKFTKDRERDVYELSKKVWGVEKISSGSNGSVGEENEKSDTDMAVVLKPNEEKLDSSKAKHEDIAKDKATQYPYLWEAVTEMADQHACGVAIRRAMTMLNDSKAKLMEEKLKRLKTTELKNHLRRIDLNKEMVKLIRDAVAISD